MRGPAIVVVAAVVVAGVGAGGYALGESQGRDEANTARDAAARARRLSVCIAKASTQRALTVGEQVRAEVGRDPRPAEIRRALEKCELQFGG